MYTYEEALNDSIKYFNGNELSGKIFVDKYALRDNDNNILENTPDSMHKRMAKEFARIEKNKFKKPYSEEYIYELFKYNEHIIPQGSPSFGIGNNYQTASISNCFVLESPKDSYGGICKTDEELVQLSKRRGGVGIDLSNLRPKGSLTLNSSRTSTGIKSWMNRYSNSIREVGQNGRRGALMLTLSVHHPDIIDFITAKNNDTDVTGANISTRLSNEFLTALENDEEYELRFPIDSDNVVRKIKAKEVWDLIIHNAWARGEPGVLFWDNIIEDSVPDCYSDYKSVSTNPCLTGNMLIATADGRNAVSIKQLVNEGKDIPVYSLNKETGLVEIKIGRNPRITGFNKQIIRVHLDNNSYLDVTENHQFILKDGNIKEGKDLVNGDSLPKFSKREYKFSTDSTNTYYRINCDLNDYKKEVLEHRLIAKFNNPELWNSIYNEEKQNGWISGGLVVHHKDYNGLNNTPSNLELMNFRDHCKLHASYDTQGEKNGRYSGFTNQDIENFALKITKKTGRRVSYDEWIDYCNKEGIPKSFSGFRHDWFKTPKELLIFCANELGFENTEYDPRVIKTLNLMLKNGYKAKIINGKVFVDRVCETCKQNFLINHLRREQCFCSNNCSIQHVIKTDGYKNSKETIRETKSRKQDLVKNKQAKIYSDLKFSLNRDPLMKEWEKSCKGNNVPYRVGRKLKYAFKNFQEVKAAGDNYNHKVVKIEYLEEKQNVYNITIDDNHTLAVITSTENGYSGIYTLQCGEIILSAYDSCRLLVLNLMKFVNKPFSKEIVNQFNFNKFYESVQIAQRLMDDLVDLELEKINTIITKIKKDPEDSIIKANELSLWKKVKSACENGRRTGLGITALGDAIAACGIQYGTDESIEFVNKIYQILKFGSYRASTDMAKELGHFPVWDWEKEKNNPFLNRIKDEDIYLGQEGFFESCQLSVFEKYSVSGKGLYEDIVKYGRRNIANLTTAPVGTISTQCSYVVGEKRYFSTTSGIEPNYTDKPFTRRKKGNPGDDSFRSDFVDQSGDHWMEFDVFHTGIQAWMENNPGEDVKNSPYNNANADQIVWTQRVKLQAAAQKHVDHSISSTVNLPNDIKKEEVAKIYNMAWKSGCKGITVYRDGCRTGVLVKKDTKEIKLEQSLTNATKRPKILPCDIYNISVSNNKYTVVVGLLDNNPYEVFCVANYIDKHKHGELIKAGKGKYVIKTSDGDLELSEHLEDDTQNALLRMVSTSLRHGASIKFVTEQLQKTKGDLTSFTKCVARALKKYIKDGDNSSEKCECGNQLVYQEGCLTCKSCGYSKCG
jgi:ribonucleotide reductase alpha subunit